MTQESYDLPRYKCHKEVGALKLKSVTYGAGCCTLKPSDPRYPPFIAPPGYGKQHKPQAGGYFILYADGYMSYSPAEAFEEGYTAIGIEDAQVVNNDLVFNASTLDNLEDFAEKAAAVLSDLNPAQRSTLADMLTDIVHHLDHWEELEGQTIVAPEMRQH